jgi:2-polyprenyl-3-methyl-5-hydroxy-6-metoxy-1,4-benzoquinol methylase
VDLPSKWVGKIVISERGFVTMTICISPEEIGKRYDYVVSDYELKRSKTIGVDYLDKFLSLLSIKSNQRDTKSFLDIGCGTGIPLTKHLVSFGEEVTGIDISPEMVKKSRINIPNATFINADISTYKIDKKFDGILAWDSLFHIPLEKQEKIIRKLIGFLKTNGVLMFTTGGEHGELLSEMFGQTFYYSSLSEDQYIKILLQGNCEVIINEIDDPTSHGHRVICCRKN